MPEHALAFSSTSSIDTGSYKLLELPSDLYKLVESAITDSRSLSLCIKGEQGDDAVLCTHDKTYAMREVVLSNSVLMVTPADGHETDTAAVVVRDTVSAVMELTPAVPRMEKLAAMLRGRLYDDGEDEAEESETQGVRFDTVKAIIQASDAELDAGLCERRVLILNGELRPLAPEYLHTILTLLLTLLVSLALPVDKAPIEELASALADEHEVARSVSVQVMQWFGTVKEGKWAVNIQALVKEIGVGILREHKETPIELDELLAKWKSLVGDTFESHISLPLLSGTYLHTTPTHLVYFPASDLPTVPAARFGHLFRTRARWSGEDIAPFLADIAVDSKDRDRLLLKFARATTDKDGAWYTARAQYVG
ncbi:sister chromatid cohesion protein Dcc1 [Infundibulicybe gibba]|nr:sister chromatid cohesion protein Dcc1 [Infundibulicybe gibba]